MIARASDPTARARGPARVALVLTLLGFAGLGLAGDLPRPGRSFRDCKVCPQMVVVPPGKFMMGRDDGEDGRYEGPVREVVIPKAFAVGRFEVTQAQYRAFVIASGHTSAGTGCNDFRGNKVEPVPGTNWQDPGYGEPVQDDQPVACVRWSDAAAYAAWLAGHTGKKYRLLTEAEWEYAARAGSSGTYTWGEQAELACRFANIHDRSAARRYPDLPYEPPPCDDGYAGLAPVGRFAPNAFGLYDMIGNVWEWIEDCYEMPYGSTPVDGSAQLAVGCDRRGVRGGSWRTAYKRQRPSFRGRDPEALTSQIFGIRVARD
ncbi:MAG: formylglycine-generating enzyme family protein [Steroidobacteraceae bacterium]